MAFVTNRLAVTTDWKRVDIATDTDTIGALGTIQGGQGVLVKNSGQVQVLIGDYRKLDASTYPLDPGEPFPVDLDHEDEFWAKVASGTGELAIAQVGVAKPS